MLIAANDYQGTGHELSCTKDAKHVQELCRACGVTAYTLYDRQCTREGMARGIHDVASQCRPGDTFLFYFSGHGTQVTDVDGDEVDHQDEAFVMVTETGSIFESDGNPCVLTDDEFVSIMTNALHPDVTTIILSDCCHSGSIADLHKPVWNGRKAISISGCRDSQTSGDIGTGGICTWSMLLAIEALQRERAMNGKTNPYSCKRLFRELIKHDDGVFASKQDITMDTCKGCNQNDVPWPLIPRSHYSTPPLPSQYKKLPLAQGQPQAQPQRMHEAPSYQPAMYHSVSQPQQIVHPYAPVHVSHVAPPMTGLADMFNVSSGHISPMPPMYAQPGTHSPMPPHPSFPVMHPAMGVSPGAMTPQPASYVPMPVAHPYGEPMAGGYPHMSGAPNPYAFSGGLLPSPYGMPRHHQR